MAIIVQGVLKDPLGNLVANVPIKVVTTSGFGDVLTTAEAIYFTDGSGNYDFNLEFATHQIYVMFTDTYELIGTTVANASVPSPTTISDLLLFSTPLPSQAEQCIRDDFGGCISALETAWDTCIVQLSTQVAQGDTGVCQAMTTYTNDRLGACSAEMTTYVNAGDAFTLQESQAYADNVGTQITCCTNLLDTRLSSVCATLSAYTAANDLAVANLCTDLTAGDAQILLQAQAYSDVCNGITCSNLSNMIQACDAAVYTCMTAISDADGLQRAGYEIVTSAADSQASIALVATACTTTGVQESCILMQADKIIMHNGTPTNQSYPFVVEANCVYMDAAYIRCLTGDKILSNTTIVAGSGTTRAGMNGDDSGTDTSNRNRLFRFWAGTEYARSATGIPVAPFRVLRDGCLIATGANISGTLNADCLVFNAPAAIPSGINNCNVIPDGKNDGSLYPDQNCLNIRSANYVTGVCGWSVDANGNAEFNNAVVRGTIIAGTGCFCGAVYANCMVGALAAVTQTCSPNESGLVCKGAWRCIKSFDFSLKTDVPFERALSGINLDTISISVPTAGTGCVCYCGFLCNNTNGCKYGWFEGVVDGCAGTVGRPESGTCAWSIGGEIPRMIFDGCIPVIPGAPHNYGNCTQNYSVWVCFITHPSSANNCMCYLTGNRIVTLVLQRNDGEFLD